MNKLNRRGLFGVFIAALNARQLPKLIKLAPKPIDIIGIEGWLPVDNKFTVGDARVFAHYYNELYEDLMYRPHPLAGYATVTDVNYMRGEITINAKT